MENKMLLPCAYSALNDEEMVYTQGGYDFSISDKALAAIGVPVVIAGIFSLVNAAWGASATRTWISKNKKTEGDFTENTVDVAVRGATAAIEYASKNMWNAAVTVVTASNMVAWWPVTLICWVSAV